VGQGKWKRKTEKIVGVKALGLDLHPDTKKGKRVKRTKKMERKGKYRKIQGKGLKTKKMFHTQPWGQDFRTKTKPCSPLQKKVGV